MLSVPSLPPPPIVFMQANFLQFNPFQRPIS